MPLNPDEVKRIRAALPDETAKLTDDAVANGAVDTMSQQAASIRSLGAELVAAKAEIVHRDVAIADLKAAVPAKIDAGVAAGHLGVAAERAGLFVDKGLVVAEAAAILKADLVGPAGDKPRLSAVGPDGKVSYSAEAVHKVLSLNAPLVKLGEATGAQVVKRESPDEQNVGLKTEGDKAEAAAKTYSANRRGGASA